METKKDIKYKFVWKALHIIAVVQSLFYRKEREPPFDPKVRKKTFKDHQNIFINLEKSRIDNEWKYASHQMEKNHID